MAYPLVTGRLSIAPLAEEDAAAFARYRQQPEVARYQSWSTAFSEADAARLIAARPPGDLPGPGEWLQLGVRVRGGVQLLGDVAVHCVAEQPDTFELGVTFAGEHQGRGYATEALLAVLGGLFTEHGAHRVIARCDARNDAIAAVLRKGGLRKESREIEADWFKGEWTTLDTYALLAREWAPRATAT
ncbi:GNAT family N-acetyltransferase [Cryobacterium tagatosivorans]|uniref:N-acetyltransferase n=1 Tax=Cryobacterium tagatosivorans TaxID=1259199 RepID=A0A4R8UC65_9MICO|nr:GNAT family N-acetyltransferase [Cryobacterium tagatosivorans]TFB46495.1 N-acetyltransferase [Cryobacterium tagatosivorans]